MGSLYVIYMIIFHATEFLNMLNLLRALRFNIEEFCASERIFVQNREIVVLVLQPKLRLGMIVGSSEMICWGGGEIYRQWKTT